MHRADRERRSKHSKINDYRTDGATGTLLRPARIWRCLCMLWRDAVRSFHSCLLHIAITYWQYCTSLNTRVVAYKCPACTTETDRQMLCFYTLLMLLLLCVQWATAVETTAIEQGLLICLSFRKVYCIGMVRNGSYCTITSSDTWCSCAQSRIVIDKLSLLNG